VQFIFYQAGWLSIFLKIYIKALSGASDLDLSVEDDKLLVGDRPRQSYNPDAKKPLMERLAFQSADELSEVNSHRW
jgi:N-terminal acetyltransferase B complex non-catalytic subunit